jgi:hypothetical protein
VLDRASDRKGQAWIFVGHEDSSPIGWVYRDYVLCPSSTTRAVATSASFNCRYARTPDEVVIRQVPKLAEPPSPNG